MAIRRFFARLGRGAGLAGGLFVALFAAPAQAVPTWERAANSGALCRALLADPETFLTSQVETARATWPPLSAEYRFFEATRVLRFGADAPFSVTVAETMEGAAARLTCDITVAPSLIGPGDRAIAFDWFQSWGRNGAKTGSLAPATAPGAHVAYQSLTPSARGCAVLHILDIAPGKGPIRGSTAEPAGCSGPAILSRLREALQ